MNSFIPKNSPTLLPYFTVTNASSAIEFYQRAFGFKLRSSAPNKEGVICHAEMTHGEALVMFCTEGSFDSTDKTPKHLGITMPLTLYIYVENVDALHEQALTHGAISKIAPNDGFWGDRFCALTDPDGYEWMFATHLGEDPS